MSCGYLTGVWSWNLRSHAGCRPYWWVPPGAPGPVLEHLILQVTEPEPGRRHCSTGAQRCACFARDHRLSRRGRPDKEVKFTPGQDGSWGVPTPAERSTAPRFSLNRGAPAPHRDRLAAAQSGLPSRPTPFELCARSTTPTPDLLRRTRHHQSADQHQRPSAKGELQKWHESGGLPDGGPRGPGMQAVATARCRGHRGDGRQGSFGLPDSTHVVRSDSPHVAAQVVGLDQRSLFDQDDGCDCPGGWAAARPSCRHHRDRGQGATAPAMRKQRQLHPE